MSDFGGNGRCGRLPSGWLVDDIDAWSVVDVRFQCPIRSLHPVVILRWVTVGVGV